MPVINKKGEPKGQGIVFKNYADRAVQAVLGGGNVIAVGNDRHIWMVKADAFVNTYRHAEDDREIKLTDLPAFIMQPEIVPEPFKPAP